MPIIDPITGKQLSGAARRKLIAARDAPDKPAAEAPGGVKRKGKRPGEAVAETQPAAAEDTAFADFPEPPLDDTSKLITWGAKVAAKTLDMILRSPSAFPNKREWFRAIMAGTASLGIIRDKATEQEKIDRHLRQADKQASKQGLTDVRGRTAPQVSRPAR